MFGERWMTDIPVEDKVMICSECGKEIPEGAVFCCWCGAQCEGKICKACGTKLRNDQLFCHECGVRWSGSEMQDTEQPHRKVSSQPEEHELCGETEDETTDADHWVKESEEIDERFIDIYCPFCHEILSYTDWQIEEGNLICPMCNGEFEFSERMRR